ncbi:MAG: MFS transporter [Chloroflexota bacterium]|nr:MFS transporter [Chloroflexota bacterium]
MAVSSAPSPIPDSVGLTASQRQRGIIALMVSNLFSWGGFFLLIPLVAVHYVDDLGWAAGTIGVMLAVRQFSQQGFSPIFGLVCDRIGPKPLICAGQLVRAAGFGGMAFAETPLQVLLTMALAGFGGAMFDAPKSAAMACLTTPAERPRRYATLGVTSGLGVTLGTQLGALLITQDFAAVALASGGVYIFLFVWNVVALPSMRVSTGSMRASEGLRMVWWDRDFILFLAISTGYFFVTAQFSLTITLAAADIAGTASAVAWIYLVNTAITVGLGYFVPRWLERWFRPVDLLIVGTLVISIGLALVGFSANIAGILVAAAVFSLGAIMARPGQETVIANLADPGARGTYFGIGGLALAIGGGFGFLFGGIAYDYGKQHELQLATWLLFFAIGSVTSVLLWANRQRFDQVRDGVSTPSATPPHTELTTVPAHTAG